MPELPDITVYIERLEGLTRGEVLERVRIVNPFVLRSVIPAPDDLAGLRVTGVSRLGKRVVLELAGGLFVVVHLMIAGRFQWKPRGARPPKRGGLAAFDFPVGTLVLTEAGSKRRASIHLVAGRAGLASHDPGGLEVLDADPGAFADRITRQRHTLKRTLTDPSILSGIGNAYSDEILHRSRLSPFKLSTGLDDEELGRLHTAVLEVLREWTDRLRAETGEGFPDKVTAFRDEMAVHGKFGQPCPVCGSRVQRIRYAESESNYCATCQTGGRLLADRSLSKLLKADWPKRVEDLEGGPSSRS
jgi:formamidopyrimidine-DNA glycosylase